MGSPHAVPLQSVHCSLQSTGDSLVSQLWTKRRIEHQNHRLIVPSFLQPHWAYSTPPRKQFNAIGCATWFIGSRVSTLGLFGWRRMYNGPGTLTELNSKHERKICKTMSYNHRRKQVNLLGSLGRSLVVRCSGSFIQNCIVWLMIFTLCCIVTSKSGYLSYMLWDGKQKTRLLGMNVFCSVAGFGVIVDWTTLELKFTKKGCNASVISCTRNRLDPFWNLVSKVNF